MAHDVSYDPAVRVRTPLGQLVLGGILLLAGTTMLLDNLQVIDLGSVWRHWPALIVIVGIAKMIQASHPKEWISAFWLVFIGTWLYVSIFRLFGLGFDESWPLLIVALGASMVLRATIAEHRHEEKGESV